MLNVRVHCLLYNVRVRMHIAQWPELLVPVGCATVLQRTQSGQKNTALNERRICVSDVNKADAF